MAKRSTQKPQASAPHDRPARRPKAATLGPTDDQIRRRAYERFLERGGAPGSELDDWLEAERELRRT